MALYPDENEFPGGGYAPPPQAPPVPPGPPGSSAPGGGGPEGGGGGAGGPGGFVLPPLPNFNQIPGAPAFNAPQFVAPNAASLYSDPGYQARLDASTRALERSAAARGALRTGGTLNDVMELGQNFASQEYGSAYQRALAAHDAAVRSAQLAYQPQLESWRLRNQGLQQAILGGYQGQIQAAMPQGGGGGGPDPLLQILPYILEGGEAPPIYGGPAGYSGMGTGDPWTDLQ